METFVLSHPLVRDQRYLTIALYLGKAVDDLNEALTIAQEAGDEQAGEILSALNAINDVAAMAVWKAAREGGAP